MGVRSKRPVIGRVRSAPDGCSDAVVLRATRKLARVFQQHLSFVQCDLSGSPLRFYTSPNGVSSLLVKGLSLEAMVTLPDRSALTAKYLPPLGSFGRSDVLGTDTCQKLCFRPKLWGRRPADALPTLAGLFVAALRITRQRRTVKNFC